MLLFKIKVELVILVYNSGFVLKIIENIGI